MITLLRAILINLGIFKEKLECKMSKEGQFYHGNGEGMVENYS